MLTTFSQELTSYSIDAVGVDGLESKVSRLQAYADYNDLMDLTEKLISEMVAELNNGSHVIQYHANGPEEDPVTIDFSPPWRRISMISGLEEALGVKFPADLASDEAQDFLSKLVGPAVASTHPLPVFKIHPQRHAFSA